MSDTFHRDPTLTIEDAEVRRHIRVYHTALEVGERPDRQALLAQYPALRDELAACLDGLLCGTPARRETRPSAADPSR